MASQLGFGVALLFVIMRFGCLSSGTHYQKMRLAEQCLERFTLSYAESIWPQHDTISTGTFNASFAKSLPSALQADKSSFLLIPLDRYKPLAAESGKGWTSLAIASINHLECTKVVILCYGKRLGFSSLRILLRASWSMFPLATLALREMF